MSIRNCIALGVAVLVCSAAWADETVRARVTGAGFSIEAPDGLAQTVSEQPLILALPRVDGFAPNVNVQVQPFGGGLEQYVQLSRGQFPAAGLELLAEPRIEGDRAIFEYAGLLEGRDLRFYSIAEAVGSRVFLVTGTAPRERWPEVGASLIRSVDSFELESPD